MKTPRQWAEHLPEPIRTEFLENIEGNKNDKYPTLQLALEMSFYWSSTSQGYKYWNELAQKVYKGEFNNAKPKQITREIQLLRDVETEVNISGIISNHTYSEIVKLLKEIENK